MQVEFVNAVQSLKGNLQDKYLIEMTSDSLDWFMEEVLQKWGWFKMEVSLTEIEKETKLFHKYGMKWSLFLRSYLTGIFETVVRQRPGIEITDRIVKIWFVLVSTARCILMKPRQFYNMFLGKKPFFY